MAEIIELELWKETIKHAFSLNENNDSNLLKTKGTFARLIHYNEGTAFLENGGSTDDSIVKSIFEDPPSGYPDELNQWRTATDISDAQYFENLNFITQNSIPMLNQLNISDKAKLDLATTGLNIFNEKELIKERNPQIFNKEIFDNLSGEVITQSQSVDYGNRIKGLYRKDIRGYDSKLLWGISEKHQRELEKKVWLSVDPAFRISELEKTQLEENKLALIDDLNNTYKDIDGYQNFILKGNELYQNNKLSIDDKLDALLDSAYAYDAQNQTAFGQIIEDNMHDNDIETIDSAMDLTDGQAEPDFDYQSLIKSGYEYVNIEKNEPITNSDLEKTLNDFRDDHRFDFKEKIANRLNEIYVNDPKTFNAYASEENLVLKNKFYELNGKRVIEKDFGNIIKELDWETKFEKQMGNIKSNKEDKIMNENLNREQLLAESIKELENPENKQDFKVAYSIMKRESGSFDGINPFDHLTTDKELANTLTDLKIKNGNDYDFRKDFPNYGNKTYESMKNEMNQYLGNRDEEVKKYIPKDELVNYEQKRSQERQNYRIFGTKESRDYNQKIDELNLAGVDELTKAFSSNKSFEDHLTKYGNLYAKYGAVNALVVSNQIEKSMKEHPNFSGDSTNIEIRKYWVNKDLYPKNSDAIGFVFVPNKEGKIANNKAVTDVKIARFYTSDSFKDYGKDHKDKSKLAAYKQRSSKPDYAIKDEIKELAYKSSLEKVYKDTEIKDPLVKLGMEYSAKKALGIAKEPFKLPREFDIKDINNPKEQLTRLNQIHKHSMRVVGLAKNGIYNLKVKLTKNNSKSHGKNLEQNKGVKQHIHKR